MEDSSIKPDDNVEEKEEDYKQYQPLKRELFDEEYDVDVLPMPRKGKNIIKMRSDKTMKKNKVKQNGYNDKLHTTESFWCQEFDLHTDYNDYDDEYSYWSYDDDSYYENYSFYNSDEWME
jgi:hypothetical protein